MIKTALMTLTAIAAVNAAQAEERRELGAHEHGHATLSMAIEGEQVVIELEAPGIDIVGFEHAASSDSDKAKIDDAKAKLADILTVLGVPNDAGCTVTSQQVALLGEEEHPEAEEHHEGEEHAEDAEHAEEHESHTEFHANYTLTCSDLPNGSAWNVGYFELFEGGEELEVNIVGEGGQVSTELDRQAPRLDLSKVL